MLAERAAPRAWARERIDDPRAVIVAGIVAFVVVVVAMWIWWPFGVTLGLVLGVTATAQLVRAMHRVTQAEFAASGDPDDAELRQEFRRLRVRLGDDWAVFGRAAVLVTRSQWGSIAGLQRELGVSTAQAQHLMGLLEREGFVGPAKGARRRKVLLASDRADELESLLES